MFVTGKVHVDINSRTADKFVDDCRFHGRDDTLVAAFCAVYTGGIHGMMTEQEGPAGLAPKRSLHGLQLGLRVLEPGGSLRADRRRPLVVVPGIVDDGSVQAVHMQPLGQPRNRVMVERHPPAVAFEGVVDFLLNRACTHPVMIPRHQPEVEAPEPGVGGLEFPAQLRVVGAGNTLLIDIVSQHESKITTVGLSVGSTHLPHPARDCLLEAAACPGITEHQELQAVLTGVVLEDNRGDRLQESGEVGVGAAARREERASNQKEDADSLHSHCSP